MYKVEMKTSNITSHVLIFSGKHSFRLIFTEYMLIVSIAIALITLYYFLHENSTL